MALPVPTLDLAPIRQAGTVLGGDGVMQQGLAEAQGESLGANTQNAIQESLLRKQALEARAKYAETFAKDPTLQRNADALSLILQGNQNPEEPFKAAGEAQKQRFMETVATPPPPAGVGDAVAAAAHDDAEAKRKATAQALSPAQYASPLVDANGRLIQARTDNVDADTHFVKPAVAADKNADAALKNAEAANNPHVGAAVGPGGLPKAPANYQWATDKDGQPVLDSQGQPTLRPITGGGKDPNAPSAATGREAIFTNRVLAAGNQAAAALGNIARGPMGQSAGIMGVGSAPGHSALTSTMDTLRNKLAPDEVQQYNVMNTGLARNFAAVEGQGLAQPGSFTGQIGEGTTLRGGDTEETKLLRMGESRQIIERGLEPKLTDPRVPEAQKALIRKMIDEVRTAIPYTVEDLQGLRSAPPGTTIADVIKARGLNKTPGAAVAPAAPGAAANAGWGTATVVEPK